MDTTRLQQAENFVGLCKGAPLGTILRALEMQKHQYEYLAKVLGCKPETNSIAAAIIAR